VNLLVLAIGLGVFAAIALAVRFHFSAGPPTARFIALAVVSGVNIFVFARELWLRPKGAVMLGLALALMVPAAALFAWSLQASRAARLKLIFDADRPETILRAGPYNHIRHPFYAAYILFWGGCAVATQQPFNIAFAVLLVPLLVAAARAEERGFERSAQAAEYAAYRRSAGLFWPRL